MPELDLLCLANSRKLNGRCVAGLKIQGGGWVRPVSNTPTGELEVGICRAEGTDVALLDVIRVSLNRARPSNFQPENWILGPADWRRLDPLPRRQLERLIDTHLIEGPGLFGGRNDHLTRADIQITPPNHSLALIEPDDLKWEIRYFQNTRKTRAVFTLNGQDYNLGVTDPVFVRRLAELPAGEYPFQRARLPSHDRCLLTISLAEPLPDGRCFKLVAAVVTI
jgi:hypothetical protein